MTPPLERIENWQVDDYQRYCSHIWRRIEILLEMQKQVAAECQKRFGRGPSVPPEMRPQIEIQHAHDLISGVLLDSNAREQLVTPDSLNPMEDCLNVLCWVLHHDHNEGFTRNLAELERTMREGGYFTRPARAEGSTPTQ